MRVTLIYINKSQHIGLYVSNWYLPPPPLFLNYSFLKAEDFRNLRLLTTGGSS
jgi:hypothetical protein